MESFRYFDVTKLQEESASHNPKEQKKSAKRGRCRSPTLLDTRLKTDESQNWHKFRPTHDTTATDSCIFTKKSTFPGVMLQNFQSMLHL